ncbi:M16 family metallopeptidase [Fervidicella metallireducens]|nr:pitrilysin family protein [Fervidicella metallireducens]
MKEIDFNKTILKNGLTIITSYRESNVFSMGIGVRVGSLYEDEKNNGISHMIEHMLFKGTKNRDVDKLNDDIEKLANEFDIYTTYHQTVLTIDIMKNKAEASIEIASDMLKNSVFPQREIRLEKNVICEEIKMEQDDAEEVSFLGLYRATFPDYWYKYHIAGTLKSVKKIKRDMLIEHYKRYYVPNNTVICIVSSYSHDEILDMVERYFGDWQPNELKEPERFSRNFIPQKVIRHKKGIEQTHVIYAFDIQGLSKREEAALALLNKKLGAGANSVLFKELRDRKGYAYSVYSSIDYTKNIEMFYIYAGISEENLKESLTIIEDIINRFINQEVLIDDEVLNLLKESFFTDAAIDMESSSNLVDYLLDGEMDYKNPLEFQNYLDVISDINVDDVKDIAKKVLKNPVIHIVLPG